MSDSIDRVFSHALNTVNKIRTGSEKPPASTRLKLYGLYKQSMEGDVEGIMDRPEGSGEEVYRAREKWDAWKGQSGLSRTEAKRRYITTLIETMHIYASPSPDARELVAELEFVWDQVKSNVPSSESSSPMQVIGEDIAPHYRDLDASHDTQDLTSPIRPDTADRGQIFSPVSGPDEEDIEETGDEFVDAQDSQYDIQAAPGDDQATSPARDTSRHRRPSRHHFSPNSSDQRWRKRVEQALVKMTAEVAALREQLESRRIFGQSRHRTMFSWLQWIGWTVLKHIFVDFIILGFVLAWLRRKKDRRLEGALKVLFGGAVAQVQKVSGKQIAKIEKIQLPKGPKS